MEVHIRFAFRNECAVNVDKSENFLTGVYTNICRITRQYWDLVQQQTTGPRYLHNEQYSISGENHVIKYSYHQARDVASGSSDVTTIIKVVVELIVDNVTRDVALVTEHSTCAMETDQTVDNKKPRRATRRVATKRRRCTSETSDGRESVHPSHTTSPLSDDVITSPPIRDENESRDHDVMSSLRISTTTGSSGSQSICSSVERPSLHLNLESPALGSPPSSPYHIHSPIRPSTLTLTNPPRPQTSPSDSSPLTEHSIQLFDSPSDHKTMLDSPLFEPQYTRKKPYDRTAANPKPARKAQAEESLRSEMAQIAIKHNSKSSNDRHEMENKMRDSSHSGPSDRCFLPGNRQSEGKLDHRLTADDLPTIEHTRQRGRVTKRRRSNNNEDFDDDRGHEDDDKDKKTRDKKVSVERKTNMKSKETVKAKPKKTESREEVQASLDQFFREASVVKKAPEKSTSLGVPDGLPHGRHGSPPTTFLRESSAPTQEPESERLQLTKGIANSKNQNKLTKNSRKLSKSSGNNREVPKLSGNSGDVPKSSGYSREMPKLHENERDAPRTSTISRNVPKLSGTDRKVTKSSRTSQKISKSCEQDLRKVAISANFRKMPKLISESESEDGLPVIKCKARSRVRNSVKSPLFSNQRLEATSHEEKMEITSHKSLKLNNISNINELTKDVKMMETGGADKWQNDEMNSSLELPDLIESLPGEVLKDSSNLYENKDALRTEMRQVYDQERVKLSSTEKTYSNTLKRHYRIPKLSAKAKEKEDAGVEAKMKSEDWTSSVESQEQSKRRISAVDMKRSFSGSLSLQNTPEATSSDGATAPVVIEIHDPKDGADLDPQALDGQIELITDVKNLTEPQLIRLVQRNKFYLRDIILEKVQCRRHDAFQRGGRARVNLTGDVYLQRYREEQDDIILGAVMDIFSHGTLKHSEYVFKVLFPEVLIRIFQQVHGIDDYDKAVEEMLNVDFDVDAPLGFG